jgi:type I restriction enzyme R subunit
MSTTSNFSFLETDFPKLYREIVISAETHVLTEPDITIFRTRQIGEFIARYLIDVHSVQVESDNTSYKELLSIAKRNQLLPSKILDLLHFIRKYGNKAAQQKRGAIDVAKRTLLYSFKVCKWLVESYGTLDVENLKFADYRAVTNQSKQVPTKAELLIQSSQILSSKQGTPLAKKQAAEQLKCSAQAASKLDYNEDETREIIDQQLRDIGWEADSINLNHQSHKTLPEEGRNIAISEWVLENKTRADYALFIGTTLVGVIEAKKYARDISSDLGQSTRYAKEITASEDYQFAGQWGDYKIPFLFAANGRTYVEQFKTKSGIWFRDARVDTNTARALRGWHSPADLKALIKHDLAAAETKMKEEEPDFLTSKDGLSLRYYQLDAIKAVEHKILTKHDDRRALLAMATGTGKTRTILGLVYRLVETKRFRRILFLVDRSLLGMQALDTFTDTKVNATQTFKDVYNLADLKSIHPEVEDRVHFATVQAVVKRIEDSDAPPSAGQYDCIIVDEAHRGYTPDRQMTEHEVEFRSERDYQSKYRQVLDYFDSYKIALTATPAIHTERIFGTPVYVYTYPQAVVDGFLVDEEPPIDITTQLRKEGVTFEKGERPKIYIPESAEVKEHDEALEDELNIEIEGFNRLVVAPNFTKVVCEQLTNHIDLEEPSKTLIFAVNNDHADQIVEALDKAFGDAGQLVKGGSILKITGSIDNPAQAVRNFKNEENPKVVVTVDLLTTGIDVPTIANLVFVRLVKSRILYEQMLGRATRLCPEIGKESYVVIDTVGQVDLMSKVTDMKPVAPNPSVSMSQVANEIDVIKDDHERAEAMLKQLMAKYNRKKNRLKRKDSQEFEWFSKGKNPEQFLQHLKGLNDSKAYHEILQYAQLWKFMDGLKASKRSMLFSDAEDVVTDERRRYGESARPDDFLQEFKQFVVENRNKILALDIVCTKPQELDRESLKALRLELAQEGYTEEYLKTAWRDAKNEDIATDIIAYIRTMALGNPLESKEERVKKAMARIRGSKKWTKVQLNWLDIFEKQLVHESILRSEDLDTGMFARKGGHDRLNKIFDDEVDNVIDLIRTEMYSAS